MELGYQIMFLAKLFACVHAMTYLERGRPGYVPCPLITSKRVSLESVDSMHWYFNWRTTPFLLVSHFQGRVHVKTGLPEDVYDIDGNFSLVIHSVTDSMEGNYVYKLKPIEKFIEIGEVPVSVKVTPKTTRPRVVGCNYKDTSSPTCEVTADTTQQTHNLTCTVENAKPAVNISITRVFRENQTEVVNNTRTHHEHQLQPENSTSPGRLKINNTFTTSASASVPLPSSDDEVKYRCEASGIAIGRSEDNHVTVTIRRTQNQSKADVSDDPENDASGNSSDSLTVAHSVLILVAILPLVLPVI